MCGDQFFGGNGKRLGRAKKVGFVVDEEFERGCQHGWIAEAFAQRIGIEPGEPEITLGSFRILQHPAQNRQRQSRGAGFGPGPSGFAR